jgi:hypothetical protein
LSIEPEKIHIRIRYKDVEQQFSAQPQEAWVLLNKFFKELIPSFEIAQKLLLNIDVTQLSEELNGIVAFSSDGASLLVPQNKLTDNEVLLVWLATYFLGYELGLVHVDSVSKDELKAKIGKSSKITSTRLGELIKYDFVAKTDDEKFRLTKLGVVQVKKEVLPKIKSKLGL